MGICRSDGKGKFKWRTCEDESTEVWHRDGMVCSEEVMVMMMKRMG